MPLKLKLGTNEHVIVNGAVMMNGGSPTTLVICNFAQILRQRDVLPEQDANTPVKRHYFNVQAMLMQPPVSDILLSSYRHSHSRLAADYMLTEHLAVLQEVDHFVGIGDYYKALRRLNPLIACEAGMLDVPRPKWTRADRCAAR